MNEQIIHNHKVNKVKLWCFDCLENLVYEDYGLEDYAPGIIDLLQGKALIHEKKTQHSTALIIYQRLPSLAELRG